MNNSLEFKNSKTNNFSSTGTTMGTTLKILRKRENLTPKDLGDKLGISPGIIYKIESDKIDGNNEELGKIINFFKEIYGEEKLDIASSELNHSNIENINKEISNDENVNSLIQKSLSEVASSEDESPKEEDSISDNSIETKTVDSKEKENTKKEYKKISSYEELGELIKSIRNEKGLDSRTFAKECNLSSSTVYKIESGRPCHIDVYRKLCDYCDLDLSILNNLGRIRGTTPRRNNENDNLSSNNISARKNINTNSYTDAKRSSSSSLQNVKTPNDKNSEIIESFYKKLTKDFMDVQIAKNQITSFGVQFNNIGYTATGKVNCYLPLIADKVLDPNYIKTIKMEYYLFTMEFSNLRKPEDLEFIVYILSDSSSTVIKIKELLYDIFNDYENFTVKSYLFSDLNSTDN